MKLKTKLLPICGTLAATAAIVTPLATSCKIWNDYRDMLCEYKSDIDPYEETLFDESSDIDELYWAQFAKKHDIVRDDILWTLSNVARTETGTEDDSGFYDQIFEKVDKFYFDIKIDDVYEFDEDNPDVALDDAAVNFTITWQFKAKYNWGTRPNPYGNIYVDYVDFDVTFKTKDPWYVWFDSEIDSGIEALDGMWNMRLERAGRIVEGSVEHNGLVCIRTDASIRYSEDYDKEGNKWEEVSEHKEIRDLDYESESFEDGLPMSGYSALYHWVFQPLYEDVTDSTGSAGVNYIDFCSHYLQNVGYNE